MNARDEHRELRRQLGHLIVDVRAFKAKYWGTAMSCNNYLTAIYRGLLKACERLNELDEKTPFFLYITKKEQDT